MVWWCRTSALLRFTSHTSAKSRPEHLIINLFICLFIQAARSSTTTCDSKINSAHYSWIQMPDENTNKNNEIMNLCATQDAIWYEGGRATARETFNPNEKRERLKQCTERASAVILGEMIKWITHAAYTSAVTTINTLLFFVSFHFAKWIVFRLGSHGIL